MTDYRYTLPDLPYDPGELEPHISARITELHHDKHHGAYVNGANTTLDRLAEARDKADYTTISMLERHLAFHLSGHVLHSVFWTILSPDGTTTAYASTTKTTSWDHSPQPATGSARLHASRGVLVSEKVTLGFQVSAIRTAPL